MTDETITQETTTEDSLLGNETATVETAPAEQDFATDDSILPTEDTATESDFAWVKDKFNDGEGNYDSEKLSESYAKLTAKLSDKGMLAPDTVDGYEFDVSEESVFDDEMLSETREFFKEIDLPAQYAQPLLDQYESRVNEVLAMVEQERAENGGVQYTADDAFTSLKEAWGKNFDAQVSNANKAITQFFDGDITEHSELANNPAFAKFAAAIGSQLNEDSAPRTTANSVSLSEEDVDRLMADPSYWEPNSHARKKVEAYFNQQK